MAQFGGFPVRRVRDLTLTLDSSMPVLRKIMNSYHKLSTRLKC